MSDIPVLTKPQNPKSVYDIMVSQQNELFQISNTISDIYSHLNKSYKEEKRQDNDVLDYLGSFEKRTQDYFVDNNKYLGNLKKQYTDNNKSQIPSKVLPEKEFIEPQIPSKVLPDKNKIDDNKVNELALFLGSKLDIIKTEFKDAGENITSAAIDVVSGPMRLLTEPLQEFLGVNFKDLFKDLLTSDKQKEDKNNPYLGGEYNKTLTKDNIKKIDPGAAFLAGILGKDKSLLSDMPKGSELMNAFGNILGKFGPWALILGGITQMAIDGIQAYFLAEEWEVSKLSAVVGGILGGTGSGAGNALKNALGKGAIGAGIGFMVGGPIGGLVGLILGGALGALFGAIGGEKIAKFIDGIDIAGIVDKLLKGEGAGAEGAVVTGAGGAAIGATIGMVGGPIGMIIGGLLGAATGALIGYFGTSSIVSGLTGTVQAVIDGNWSELQGELIGAGIGAGVGLAFGPLGIIIGAILGTVTASIVEGITGIDLSGLVNEWIQAKLLDPITSFFTGTDVEQLTETRQRYEALVDPLKQAGESQLTRDYAFENVRQGAIRTNVEDLFSQAGLRTIERYTSVEAMIDAFARRAETNPEYAQVLDRLLNAVQSGQPLVDTEGNIKFHSGGISRQEQMAILRKDETVLSPSESIAYRDMMRNESESISNLSEVQNRNSEETINLIKETNMLLKKIFEKKEQKGQEIIQTNIIGRFDPQVFMQQRGVA